MKQINLKKRRIFSESYKKSRVKEYESGQLTVREIAQLYGIGYQTVYLWIYKYSSYNKKSLKVVEHKDSHKYRLKQLQDRIKELEQIIGQKQIQVDYLEKIIELAKIELEIDLKKNFDPLQSSGSGSTEDPSRIV
jgi:transposase-like protein